MKRLPRTNQIYLLTFFFFLSFLNAATLPDSTPVPELCGIGPGPRPEICAENFGAFEITNSLGEPVHTIKVGDYILVRYIEPPEGTVVKPNRPGRDFHLISPDLDGTGIHESWVNNSGVVRIINDNIFDNILYSDDIDLQAPDRSGPPDTTYDPIGKRGWKVWHGDSPYGPGTLYQKTLKLENVPENQANRWLIMDTGYGQQWPLSFQQFPLLSCGPATADKEEYNVADTVNITVRVTSGINTFNGRRSTYTDVTLSEVGAGTTLRLISGPSPSEVATLAPDTFQDFTFAYEALEDGPANLKFQAKGINSDGDAIFSRACPLLVFVGGKGDLIVRDLQNTPVSPLGDNYYAPDSPLIIFPKPASTTRGANYIVTVQNDGESDNSFYLKLAETGASGWKNRYLFEGRDAGNELKIGLGLLVPDLASGASKDVEVFLEPGEFLEECSRVSNVFKLALASGNNDTMDSVKLGAESINFRLKATLAAEPVAGSTDHFELTLEVKNKDAAEAKNIFPRIPISSSGDGTFEFVGNTEPNIVPSLPSGATATFKRTVRRLTPGEITIKADASANVPKGNSSRRIFSNEASVDLEAGVTLEIEVQPAGTRQKDETFMARVTVKSNRPDPQEVTFSSPFVGIEKSTVLEVGEADPPGTFTLSRSNPKAVFDIPILAKEAGVSEITTRCMVSGAGGTTENLDAKDTAIVAPLKMTMRALPLKSGKPIVDMEIDEDDKITDDKGNVIVPKIEVTFENLGSEPVTARLQGLDPRARDKKKVGARVKVTGTFPLDLGTIPAKGKITKEFPLVIKDDGRFEFTAVATATADGTQFNLSEKGAPIAVGGAYPVELEINIVRDPTILQSGRKGVHLVHPGGTLKLVAGVDNRTTNSTLTFLGIESKKELNALGGVLTTEKGNAVDPPMAVDHFIESGESVILTGEVQTLPDGPGSGIVEFLVLVDGKLTDDKTKKVTTVTEDDILITGDATGYLGNDLKIRIIQGNSKPPRRVLTPFETVGIYTEATFTATGKWMYDGLDMLGGVGRIAGRISADPSLLADYYGEGSRVMWEFTEMVANTWDEMSPDERKAFILSAVREVQRRTLLLDPSRFSFDPQDALEVRAYLERVTYPLFGGVSDAYATDDPEEIARLWGTVSGNIAPEVITAFLPTPNFTQYVKAAELSKLAKNTGLARSINVQENLLRTIKAGPISIETALKAFGMGAQDISNFMDVFRRFKVKGYARERSPVAYKLINQLKEAVWKPEKMKPKGMTELDRLIIGDTFSNPITVPGKTNNPIELEGLTAIYWPDNNTVIRNRLRQAGEPEEVVKAAVARAQMRREEYGKFLPEFEKWKEDGISVAKNYKDNGVPDPDVLATDQRAFDFLTIERPGKPPLYIPKMADEAGNLRYISGDIDWVHFSFLDGTPLDPETARKLYTALLPFGFEHPETVSWIKDGVSVFKGKANQLVDYVKGQKALIEISELGPRAVHISESLTRLAKNGRSHRIFFDNGLKSWAKASLLDVDSAFAHFQTRFPHPRVLIPFLWVNRAGDQPTADLTLDGSDWKFTSSNPAALVLRADAEGRLEQFDGAAWIPFVVPPAGAPRAKDNHESLDLSPTSALDIDASAGSDVLSIINLPDLWSTRLAGKVANWFEVGQIIIIAPGEISQEIHTITAVGATFTIATPLRHSHPEGTLVAVVPDNMTVSDVSDIASTLLATTIEDGRAHMVWRTLEGRYYSLEEVGGAIIRQGIASQGITTVISLALSNYDETVRYQLRETEPLPARVRLLSFDHLADIDILAITWVSTIGKRYQIESLQARETETWEDLGLPIIANGEITSANLPIAADVVTRFYRVRQLD